MTISKKRVALGRWDAWRHQHSGNVRSIVGSAAKGVCLGLLAAGIALHPAVAADIAAEVAKLNPQLAEHAGAAAPSAKPMQPASIAGPKRANFEKERASREAKDLADWVVDSGDSRKMPFVIVDKKDAKVFVFDAAGRLRGAAPALLGLAHGDDTVPGIGDRPLSSIRPEERTTPAGRFVAALGQDLKGEILWIDYDAAISMHPVINTNLKERRPQRLATPTPLDNRISFGCINVPAKFYKNVVHTAFSGTDGIVYVLPETKSARVLFASYDVDEHAQLQLAKQSVPEQIASQSAPAPIAAETAAH